MNTKEKLECTNKMIEQLVSFNSTYLCPAYYKCKAFNAQRLEMKYDFPELYDAIMPVGRLRWGSEYSIGLAAWPNNTKGRQCRLSVLSEIQARLIAENYEQPRLTLAGAFSKLVRIFNRNKRV